MEFRKVFDTVPEQFDKYRPRYSAELFADLIAYAGVGEGKEVLELGPGTGQATDPILATGCDYNAIEIGENFFEKMNTTIVKAEGFKECYEVFYETLTSRNQMQVYRCQPRKRTL